jgi:anaerobic magnesium-protoporphyrin IX monomethyl ester cyclase
MRVLLLNPPHPSIGSRIPREHLPPLGLLALGGPLLDAGHHVKLLDAEFGPMPLKRIISQARDYAPDAILMGHSGSTSGQPMVCRIARAARDAIPHARIIYGGVFPTYHWADIMKHEPAIDIIVRGEGEETIVRLISALESGQDLEQVPGIVFRAGTEPGRDAFHRVPFSVPYLGRGGTRPYQPEVRGRIIATRPPPVIADLDANRIGWELIDHRRYTYYGKRRAVVVQFSRGCPHHCHYCGQHGFWRQWRHRDPVKFAAELARLHREQGVELINFADENPSADREAWQAFLEALIAQNVPLILIGTTRASDIVRDADILHLYKKAGIARFLLGMESTDEATLQAIHKGSTKAIDREAIRLMRQHGIISMAAWVAGFVQEKDSDYWRTLRQLLSYDPDQIQALYATPHSWTPFALQQAKHRVVQTDLSRWDYKHQVLESTHVPNWRVLLWVKSIEAICQLRPKSLWRLLAHPDKTFRAGMRWYSSIGKRVWIFEIWQWFFFDRRTRHGPSVGEFLKGGWKNNVNPRPHLEPLGASARNQPRLQPVAPAMQGE